MKTRHCGDGRKHAPHSYYGPTSKKGGTGQEAYYCPGSN